MLNLQKIKTDLILSSACTWACSLYVYTTISMLDIIIWTMTISFRTVYLQACYTNLYSETGILFLDEG